MNLWNFGMEQDMRVNSVSNEEKKNPKHICRRNPGFSGNLALI